MSSTSVTRYVEQNRDLVGLKPRFLAFAIGGAFHERIDSDTDERTKLIHLQRYSFAARFGHGIVLDLGCGLGKGTGSLRATRRIGCDINLAAVKVAKGTVPTAEFVCASAVFLPFRSGLFDLIVSLETIEHVQSQDMFVHEVARVLATHGKVVLSTPNRITVSPLFSKPYNPYHAKEFTSVELKRLLQANGIAIQGVFGQEYLPLAYVVYVALQRLFFMISRTRVFLNLSYFARVPKTVADSRVSWIDRERTRNAFRFPNTLIVCGSRP